MLHLYHYVPPCKRCGSYKTGYYIHGLVTADWIIKRALRHGEYAMITSEPLTSDTVNCFCGECGIEWHEDDIQLKILNEKQFEEQLKLRDIDTATENADIYFENEKEAYEKIQKAEKNKKKWYRKAAKAVKTSWFGNTKNSNSNNNF